MLKKTKRMYLVKREVFATSIERAIITKGKIYEITIADEKYSQIPPKENLGFKKKK